MDPIFREPVSSTGDGLKEPLCAELPEQSDMILPS